MSKSKYLTANLANLIQIPKIKLIFKKRATLMFQYMFTYRNDKHESTRNVGLGISDASS